MKKILILVEGQTEETVVRDVLSPYLGKSGIYSEPVILETKREKCGRAFKGGIRSFDQVRRDLLPLLDDSSAVAVTTLIDYYGLPPDFPGLGSRPDRTPDARVAHVEAAFAAEINNPRFIPHLTLHEMEAWVYVAPLSCAWVFGDQDVARKLESIREASGGAERINEAPATAPSKRILSLAADYQKAIHGPMAIEATGIDSIRRMCPHADRWLRRLEALSA
jgi:hypothetical protein